MKGYNTGVVDADEHGDTPHDAGPLPLELVGLSQMAVEAGVQQADNSCEEKGTNRPRITRDKQKLCETPAGKSCHGAAVWDYSVCWTFASIISDSFKHLQQKDDSLHFRVLNFPFYIFCLMVLLILMWLWAPVFSTLYCHLSTKENVYKFLVMRRHVSSKSSQIRRCNYLLFGIVLVFNLLTFNQLC